MKTFSPATEKLREEVREWALARVRTLAREADIKHGIPDGMDEALAAAPVSVANFDEMGHEAPAAEAAAADGAGIVSAILVEDVAFADVWPFYVGLQGLGVKVVKGIGTPEQIERWVDPVVRGEIRTTGFALTEPGTGSDTSNVETTARLEGDHWILNGSKMYCTMGASSDYAVVFATIDKEAGPGGIRAFVVEKETAGRDVVVANEKKMGLRASETTEFKFENCAIPLDHLLGYTEEGGIASAPGMAGIAPAMEAMARTRPLVGGQALGLGRAARQVAGDWAAERRGEFTRERWARIEEEFTRMDDALDQARRVVHQAVWETQQSGGSRRTTSAGKAFCPPIAERVIRRCVQIMGADGYSQEYLVEKWYRDIKIFDIFEGSGQIHRNVIARALMGRGAARG